jgi:hypothetical protein
MTMGKRSKFERRDHDFYPTPRAAVLPLIPHLRGICRFAEPCAADGDLVRHLESFGLRCVYAGDIRSGQDALELDHYGLIDSIITNPPYLRELMHRMILHFQQIAPTWLLLGADWASTKQAAPFLPACSDIVPIGRVRWFEGTEFASMENFAWYRFDGRHTSGPVFHGRDHVVDAIPIRRRACDQCGRGYELHRSSSRFCSGTCRTRARRQRLSVSLSVSPDHSQGRPLTHPESIGHPEPRPKIADQ